MAYQTKQGISVSSGPRTVLQRHALAALLGAVAAEWALLEGRVMHLYAYLMGVNLRRCPGYEPPIHPVALQVFDTLETLRLRMNLLKKLGSWVLKSEELERELNEIVLGSIKRASKMRNAMLHAEWGIASEYPDALILLPTFGHPMVYSEGDFQEAIDRIAEARSQLGQFEIKARSHLDPKC